MKTFGMAAALAAVAGSAMAGGTVVVEAPVVTVEEIVADTTDNSTHIIVPILAIIYIAAISH